jgi:hypothetical protein
MSNVQCPNCNFGITSCSMDDPAVLSILDAHAKGIHAVDSLEYLIET